ncbi:DUF5916 domain-containing protein [candidate division KSB1 bacterium]
MNFICRVFVSAILLICFFQVNVYSQEINAVNISGKIVIDGKLNETEWENAQAVTGFTQFEPDYGTPASLKTYVKVLFDNEMIYFGFDCKDSDISLISTKVTQRDGEVYEDDAIAFIIDTFNDKNNAYMFQVNALGTQQDERWADNGRTRDTKWDIRWSSAGNINSDGWTAEVAIPLDVIKFDKNSPEWGLNVIRYIPRNREMSHWSKGLTEWFRIAEIGTINGLDLEDYIGKNYTIIPYIQSQTERGRKSEGDVGGDVRLNFSSNFGIDATFNPDFATIEADVVQVNMSRFELSYPEKRPFFMEGGENYSTRIKQFYSRRIGEIPWGLKLNGKADSWKINALTTQSDPSTANPGISAGEDANYTVFRVNKETFNSSNIGIIGANRYYSDKNKGSIGLAGTLFFTNALGLTTQFIKSYGDFEKGSWTYFVRPSFDSKNGHFHVRYTHVGENVRENMNGIGYIRDDDRREVDSNIKRNIWFTNSWLDQIVPTINYNRYWSQTGNLRSWNMRNEIEILFLKRWQLDLEYGEEFRRFEKGFRNTDFETELSYDNNQGQTIAVVYGEGLNYEMDYEKYGVEMNFKLREGWDLSYEAERYWFKPDLEDENTLFHAVNSTYYVNKDMYFKLFYQSQYDVFGGYSDPEFDLSRETVQFVYVWRFLPPFGSFQLAFQQGSTQHTEIIGRGKTLFTKLSWVF